MRATAAVVLPRTGSDLRETRSTEIVPGLLFVAAGGVIYGLVGWRSGSFLRWPAIALALGLVFWFPLLRSQSASSMASSSASAQSGSAGTFGERRVRLSREPRLTRRAAAMTRRTV